MELPLPVIAFLMVFAAAACTLLLVGLWAIIVRLIIVLTLFSRFLIESSYRLISGLVQGTHELRGRAANTAQRFLAIPKQKKERGEETDELPLAARLLKSILSDEDREHIIGDVVEEFSLFESKLKAYLWLYKQVLTSAWPLICKTVERNLASMFKKRIR